MALEKKDEAALISLEQEYPEIFDAKFMMDLLRNEIERIRQGLDDNMIFTNNLFTYQ